MKSENFKFLVKTLVAFIALLLCT